MRIASNLYIKMVAPGWLFSCNTGIKVTSARASQPDKPARSIKPPLSNRPPLFRGGKLISPPKVPHPPSPPLHLYSSKTINVD